MIYYTILKLEEKQNCNFTIQNENIYIYIL